MSETILTDSWKTPSWLLKLFVGWYDPCPINGTKGLEKDWKDKTFVNPPYSNPLPWVEKALAENAKGKTIALLLKLDTSTRWFLKLQECPKSHFITFFGRLKFEGQRQNYPANFPSVLCILEGREASTGLTLLHEVRNMMAENPLDVKDLKPFERAREILRASLIAELDAISLYEQFASNASPAIKRVLNEVNKDEKEHFRLFLKALIQLDPEQAEEVSKLARARGIDSSGFPMDEWFQREMNSENLGHEITDPELKCESCDRLYPRKEMGFYYLGGVSQPFLICKNCLQQKTNLSEFLRKKYPHDSRFRGYAFFTDPNA